jgi:DNA-directed RNA polymerase specialized sigma24 family protein
MLPIDVPPLAGRPRRDWEGLARTALRVALKALPGDEDGAADVAQDAILKLLLIERPPRSLEAWLRIVVARGVADLRARAELDARAATEVAAGAVAEVPDPERVAMARELLATFPPHVRRLLLLHADGLPTRDLARAVGRRRIVVARQLREALEAARERLGRTA